MYSGLASLGAKASGQRVRSRAVHRPREHMVGVNMVLA